jgi:hypothetical protein
MNKLPQTPSCPKLLDESILKIEQCIILQLAICTSYLMNQHAKFNKWTGPASIFKNCQLSNLCVSR